MILITDSKKHEVWNHFVERWALMKGRNLNITAARLRKIKLSIFQNDHFWDDIVQRHDLSKKTPEELKNHDLFLYGHCNGNFWGMILKELVAKGLVK